MVRRDKVAAHYEQGTPGRYIVGLSSPMTALRGGGGLLISEAALDYQGTLLVQKSLLHENLTLFGIQPSLCCKEVLENSSPTPPGSVRDGLWGRFLPLPHAA